MQERLENVSEELKTVETDQLKFKQGYIQAYIDVVDTSWEDC